MTSRADEVQTAMDTGILDVTVSHGSQLLAKVGTVLIFDVSNDGVPATFVVDLVTISRGVDDVEAQLDAVLDNN